MLTATKPTAYYIKPYKLTTSVIPPQPKKAEVSRRQVAMVTETTPWIDPKVQAPPLGVKVQALTWWGVATYTNWSRDAHVSFAAWAPLPKVEPWLREKLETGRPNERK